MIVTSPHLYRRAAKSRGVPPEIVSRALQQSKAPERQGLPAILTLAHLAHLTGATYQYLRDIVARERDAYRTFVIRKRRGGQRLIAVPEPQLAAVQRWIVDNVLLERPHHAASYAYHRGASPVECARQHLGARWLVKVDIHDFFESISERRVYFAFRNCGYQPLVSFELARLCTRISTGNSPNLPHWRSERHSFGVMAYSNHAMGHLPQGAPPARCFPI
jgi:RNA-directed DNA polymerase